jgi:hypothetical protein
MPISRRNIPNNTEAKNLKSTKKIVMQRKNKSKKEKEKKNKVLRDHTDEEERVRASVTAATTSEVLHVEGEEITQQHLAESMEKLGLRKERV